MVLKTVFLHVSILSEGAICGESLELGSFVLKPVKRTFLHIVQSRAEIPAVHTRQADSVHKDLALYQILLELIFKVHH